MREAPVSPGAHPFRERLLDGLADSIVERGYRDSTVADIVRRYDVDGIHADDYFYPYPPQKITTQDNATYSLYSRGIADRGDWRRDNVNLLGGAKTQGLSKAMSVGGLSATTSGPIDAETFKKLVQSLK